MTAVCRTQLPRNYLIRESSWKYAAFYHHHIGPMTYTVSFSLPIYCIPFTLESEADTCFDNTQKAVERTVLSWLFCDPDASLLHFGSGWTEQTICMLTHSFKRMTDCIHWGAACRLNEWVRNSNVHTVQFSDVFDFFCNEIELWIASAMMILLTTYGSVLFLAKVKEHVLSSRGSLGLAEDNSMRTTNNPSCVHKSKFRCL